MDTHTASPDQLQKQIAEARRHLARLEAEQAAAAKLAISHETDPETDWLHGGEEIAAFLKWPKKRVYAQQDKLKGAIFKTGHRTLIGSRSRLRALPELLSKTP
jgi:hypothetical protein